MKLHCRRHFIGWGALVLLLISAGPKQAAELDQDHRIAPLEILIIDVFGETNLSKEIRVQASGKISYPLLGDVDVAGKTTREVEIKLKELLGKDYLVDPQVLVAVKEYRQRSVNVIGEVMKPGAIPLPGEQKWTIIDAIGQAGGLTKLARKKIEFIRQGKIQKLDLDDLKKTTDPSKIIYLEPGDTITIPQTLW